MTMNNNGLREQLASLTPMKLGIKWRASMKVARIRLELEYLIYRLKVKRRR